MKKLIGDEIKDLLFVEMTDIQMIQMIDRLGLEQPTVDEKFEEEREILILDKQNTGLSFGFEEVENCSQNGDLCLVDIGFYSNEFVSFPYEIIQTDNYGTVKEKIGRKADFRDHEIFPEMRMWIMEDVWGRKYTVNVFFEDEEILEGISTIVVQQFKPSLHNTNNYTVCED